MSRLLAYITTILLLLLLSGKVFSQKSNNKLNIGDFLKEHEVSQTKPENTNAVLIYPNPISSSSIVKINIPSEKGYKLFIYNEEGVLLKIYPVFKTGKISLSRSDFHSGFYIIKVQILDTEKIISRKILLH